MFGTGRGGATVMGTGTTQCNYQTINKKESATAGTAATVVGGAAKATSAIFTAVAASDWRNL